ncbi:MAG: response regulator [Chlorobi bacterium]|nr:response regulator [Chlorobiota bacterium]
MDSILIVDDDIKLCATLSEDLNEIGYYTRFVTTADGAINYLNSSSVDLILLDLRMPNKDGFYVINHINNSSNYNLRIIVLTANVDIDSAIESAKLGVDEFLRKPYDFDELLITVKRVLQKEAYEN